MPSRMPYPGARVLYTHRGKPVAVRLSLGGFKFPGIN